MNTDMKTLTAVIVLALSSAPLFAQEGENAGDEITVIRAPSLQSLRADLVRAEDAAYALFNELNDDDAYDIICKKETRIGSQFRNRVCLPAILRDTEVEQALDEDTGIVSRKASQPRHQRILTERMRQLAIENPELLEALKDRLALKKRLEEERIKRYGK
jgi:hypothetical protein